MILINIKFGKLPRIFSRRIDGLRRNILNTRKRVSSDFKHLEDSHIKVMGVSDRRKF